jgi:hypothetical protein
MDSQKNPPRSVQLWRCRCGTRFRAVSELLNPPGRTKFECPTCGTAAEIEGKPIEITYQQGEAWIKIMPSE